MTQRKQGMFTFSYIHYEEKFIFRYTPGQPFGEIVIKTNFGDPEDNSIIEIDPAKALQLADLLIAFAKSQIPNSK